MQKVIIDTNVFVSALIQRSYPHLIVRELFVEQKIELCVSDELLAEYYDVLSRPKFSRFPDFFIRAEVLLADIDRRAVKYFPTTKIDLISDRDDNKILELADTSQADFIVTGNVNDFTFSLYKTTRILTPKEYWTLV
ncbi:putative toxin-antitoxin system toxin component, PIN family [Dyadobacter sp. CY261]|uniref:putative toxin-antitoxin system toxin component, PIN family n=1 Tax=Dyadobacter sp. CY261 TaxID=2907203 RepID=UPI001F222E3E|nr:putative toxin-antitoxin system toxin component, PIN family [Dyadobacter sp. CY261]MCF0074427.1 putative toxin-antitoxin system toxin component, PIN family [Dyadobacter sp. CY261]